MRSAFCCLCGGFFRFVCGDLFAPVLELVFSLFQSSLLWGMILPLPVSLAWFLFLLPFQLLSLQWLEDQLFQWCCFARAPFWFLDFFLFRTCNNRLSWCGLSFLAGRSAWFTFRFLFSFLFASRIGLSVSAFFDSAGLRGWRVALFPSSASVC